jgi:hypothetical protein
MGKIFYKFLEFSVQLIFNLVYFFILLFLEVEDLVVIGPHYAITTVKF